MNRIKKRIEATTPDNVAKFLYRKFGITEDDFKKIKKMLYIYSTEFNKLDDSTMDAVYKMDFDDDRFPKALMGLALHKMTFEQVEKYLYSKQCNYAQFANVVSLFLDNYSEEEIDKMIENGEI